MLKQLYIKDFTLIDTLDMRFFPGFSVITGETGAGKSIILGAINLLLGQRADMKQIKAGCSRCVIEAHFDLSRYDMKGFFDENDIDYDADDCILRRELTSAGKSRAFINDTPVPLTTMRRLGEQLIDIHSQHQNLLLNDEDFQLNVVDIIAKDRVLADDYRQEFYGYMAAGKEVDRVRREIEEGLRNEDFIRFQYNELCNAELEPGMQEALEQESDTLNHVEEIKNAMFTADAILGGSDGDGVVERLKEAVRTLGGICNIYPDIKDAADRIDSCYIELKDIADEVRIGVDGISFDPQRLEVINSKLDRIYSLQQKHHVSTVDELLKIQEHHGELLENIDNSDVHLKELEAERQRIFRLCEEKAARLSELRRMAAGVIEGEMQKRLVALGMPNVRFSVDVEPRELSADGADRVVFMFSANKNMPLQPVSQVASGGEIARVMLSLKAMISGAVKLPTIIFDEIDTGVSGKAAERMAMIMQEMAQKDRQVISITHLPQIAARGTTHYKVYKIDTPGGTESRMEALSPEERVQEIAQMLSGSDVSEAAVSNAKELLGMI